MPQISRQALDIVLREHQHISSSLLANRQKGVIRFNLYVVLVGTALLISGLKEAGVTGVTALSVVGGFFFILTLGWLMLITLIRRSITTDLHLMALKQIRTLYGPNVANAIPTLGQGFEKIKLRYYENPTNNEAIPNVDAGLILPHLWKNQLLLPHYGDLIENICSINSMAVAFLAAWSLSYLPEVHTLAIIVAFFSALVWAWCTQIMYSWYKHATDKGILLETENKEFQEAIAHGGEKYNQARRRFRNAVFKVSGSGLALLVVGNVVVVILTRLLCVCMDGFLGCN